MAVQELILDIGQKLHFRTGMHNPRPMGGIRRSQSRFKNTRNFTWMTEILWF